MDLAGMKYGFSASFHHEQMFFGKAKGYTAPKCLTKVEYVLMRMKYAFLARFHCEQTIFCKTEDQLLWVLSRILIFFKTLKQLRN
jgi:hypothetical protein